MENSFSPMDFLQPPVDAISTVVQSALEGFKTRHPYLSKEHLEMFRGTVEHNVKVRHLSRQAEKVYHQLRKERSALLSTEMKSLGLLCFHDQHFYIYEDEFHPKYLRGLTAVYKIDGDEMTLAASFCSDNDNFDKLIGREIALDRYKNGLTLTVSTNDHSLFDLTYDFCSNEDSALRQLYRKYTNDRRTH